MEGRIRVGISTCLLGEPVRYDGSHKLDRFLVHTLGEYVDYVPVCPEVECGLPVPRPSMRLVGNPAAPRLVTTRTGEDHTERMEKWAKKRVLELEREVLCGFIFKSRSPSSGMAGVKIYDDNGMPSGKGSGLFARTFIEHFPLIPVEDEGRLQDPELRENFIERIFALKRWRELEADSPGGKAFRGRLVVFHTRHKLLILSHSPRHYSLLGRLTAGAAQLAPAEISTEYLRHFVEALGLRATVKKHANVLHHAMGYFKKQLSVDEKQELLEIIGAYYRGFVPLIVPVTLLNHYVRKYKEPYLAGQHYLNPHPLELKLRNHA